MSNDAPQPEPVATFAGVVFRPADIAEVRLVRGVQAESSWHVASELRLLAPWLKEQNQNGWHVYVGANPRPANGQRGDDCIALARCVFADFDGATEDEARQRIEAAGLPAPTMLIFSGHGFHAYWLLAAAVTNLAAWRELMKDLAAVLGSDPKICNPERIMRLPGFINCKPDKPAAMANIVDVDSSRAYSWGAIRAVVSAREVQPAKSAVSTSTNRPATGLHPYVAAALQAEVAKLKAAAVGDRNDTLNRAAFSLGQLVGGGELSASDVERELAAAASGWIGQKMTAGEITKTIRSGMESGQREPRRIPDKPTSAVAKGKPKRSAPIGAYKPFPTSILPPVFARFIREGAVAMGCDDSCIALPALVAAASAIGNTRRIQLKATWSEPSVLWGALLLPSGNVKSSAQELALKPIQSRQRRLIQEYRAAMAVYDDEHAEWKSTPKAERGDEPDRPAPLQHPLVSDITVEALADRLEATPRGTLVAVDELAGWLSGLNQYKGGRGGDLAAYLNMHRAGR